MLCVCRHICANNYFEASKKSSLSNLLLGIFDFSAEGVLEALWKLDLAVLGNSILQLTVDLHLHESLLVVGGA